VYADTFSFSKENLSAVMHGDCCKDLPSSFEEDITMSWFRLWYNSVFNRTQIAFRTWQEL